MGAGAVRVRAARSPPARSRVDVTQGRSNLGILVYPAYETFKSVELTSGVGDYRRW
jgi:hypothetical protein